MATKNTKFPARHCSHCMYVIFLLTQIRIFAKVFESIDGYRESRLVMQKMTVRVKDSVTSISSITKGKCGLPDEHVPEPAIKVRT